MSDDKGREAIIGVNSRPSIMSLLTYPSETGARDVRNERYTIGWSRSHFPTDPSFALSPTEPSANERV